MAVILFSAPIRGQVFKFQFWLTHWIEPFIEVMWRLTNQRWIAAPKLKFEDLTPAHAESRMPTAVILFSGFAIRKLKSASGFRLTAFGWK